MKMNKLMTCLSGSTLVVITAMTPGCGYTISAGFRYTPEDFQGWVEALPPGRVQFPERRMGIPGPGQDPNDPPQQVVFNFDNDEEYDAILVDGELYPLVQLEHVHMLDSIHPASDLGFYSTTRLQSEDAWVRDPNMTAEDYIADLGYQSLPNSLSMALGSSNAISLIVIDPDILDPGSSTVEVQFGWSTAYPLVDAWAYGLEQRASIVESTNLSSFAYLNMHVRGTAVEVMSYLADLGFQRVLLEDSGNSGGMSIIISAAARKAMFMADEGSTLELDLLAVPE